MIGAQFIAPAPAALDHAGHDNPSAAKAPRARVRATATRTPMFDREKLKRRRKLAL
jgi:hypothetical protein